MKILFVTSPSADYLADALLHGLRCLFGASLVDYPKADILYSGCDPQILSAVRGNGFTLYTGLLQDLPVDRSDVFEKVKRDFYDLVIFGNIWRTFGNFVQLRPWLKPSNTLILDGEDSVSPYPASGLWWRRPYYWLLPRAHRRYAYFKRELTADTRFGIGWKLAPAIIRKKVPLHSSLRPIAFSIPAEKIVRSMPEKTKDFPQHIVDGEVAAGIGTGNTQYVFGSEDDYYRDLQSARFGITTKRSGWDCLRHYEIAANAAVPAFRNLLDKPRTCAPHGLDDSNSLSYKSALDLFNQVRVMSPSHYLALQQGALSWVREQTTETRAAQMLEAWRLSLVT